MLYLCHGENELALSEAVADISARLDIPPDMRSLNTIVLEGATSLGELRRAASAIPFLGGARLVIARDMLSKAKGQDAQEIADYLPDVPPTTCLIFAEGQGLPAKHPVRVAVSKLGEERRFELPKARDLMGWIRDRVKSYGGGIEPAAANLLAQNIGLNLRLLDQEIRKLRLYCGERQTITAEDVQVMVPYVQSADVIFDMVDALGQRDPRRAASHLHRLLDVGEHPLGLFGMIVRQFRLLIQTRWLMDRGSTEGQIAERLKLHPYVAQKVRAQSTRFTLEQLHAAYRLLGATDLSIKRGLLEADVALDVLVARLTRMM